MEENKIILKDSKKSKIFFTEDYKYIFEKRTGYFRRWGKTIEEDPQFSPFGPEILDIEITTKCNGIKGKLCDYCYKSNTTNGKNMSLADFKIIIDKINKNNQLTQVAFGLGSTGEENPEFWGMCKWLKEERGIIPNGTVADISDETADKISNIFGACAVSYHNDKNVCYNSIKKLTDRGMKQVNMHFCIHKDNYIEAILIIDDIESEERLAGMNALVFLGLKQKGRAKDNIYTTLSQDKFEELCYMTLNKKINIGFDSCSSTKFLNFINKNEEYEKLETYIEPCESFGLFSSYVNVDGIYFPCSFAEGEGEWKDGLSVLDCNDFIDEIWNGELVSKYRDLSLKNERNCLFYKI